MLDHMKTMKSKVFYMMQRYPGTKDCDKKLWLHIMWDFFGMHEVVESFEDFEAWLLSKKTPSFESVRRVRQKIQENFPTLRGSPEVYKKRQKEEKKVRHWARQKGMET